MPSALVDVIDQVCPRTHGLITHHGLRSAGVSSSAISRAVQSGRLVPVERGIYRAAGSPYTWNTRVLAATLASSGVASHRSAAVLWGLEGFAPGPPEVTVPRGVRFRRPDVRVHETKAWGLVAPTVRQSIPVTGVDRMVIDLAAVLDGDRLELLVDEVIRRRLVDWERIGSAFVAHAARGRAGITRLRMLLVDRFGSEATDSVLERFFLRLLIEAALPAPVLHHVVFDDDGFIAEVDCAYPDLKLAIELDGRQHHLHGAAFEADRGKRNRLKLAGWLLLEFTYAMVVGNPRLVVRQLERAIVSCGGDPHPATA